MEREWLAMLGAAGFIAMMLASAFTMSYFEKRKRREREQRASPTPPPARH